MRLLNLGYMVEIVNGRLNGSAEQVELNPRKDGNVTYVKKINGKGTVSAPCQKYNIQRYMKEQGYQMSKKIKDGKQIISSADPINFVNEDIFGFMKADKTITKKRKSRWLMSHLTQVDNSRINTEWNVCKADNGENMPYNIETYSGLFAGISNINIDEISKFNVSDTDEYKDYSTKDKIKEESLQVSKEEKYNKIKTALEGLRYLSIEGNQNNYLTDTSPKVVIMGEYKFGNAIFQGVLNRDGINIEALKETIEDNDRFRISDIWIGVSSRVYNENIKQLKNKLIDEFKDYDFIHVGTVGNAFNNYLSYLEETM